MYIFPGPDPARPLEAAEGRGGGLPGDARGVRGARLIIIMMIIIIIIIKIIIIIIVCLLLLLLLVV